MSHPEALASSMHESTTFTQTNKLVLAYQAKFSKGYSSSQNFICDHSNIRIGPTPYRRRIRPEVANAEILMGNHSRKQKANTNSLRSKRSPGYLPPISVHLIAALSRAPSWHNL